MESGMGVTAEKLVKNAAEDIEFESDSIRLITKCGLKYIGELVMKSADQSGDGWPSLKGLISVLEREDCKLAGEAKALVEGHGKMSKMLKFIDDVNYTSPSYAAAAAASVYAYRHAAMMAAPPPMMMYPPGGGSPGRYMMMPRF